MKILYISNQFFVHEEKIVKMLLDKGYKVSILSKSKNIKSHYLHYLKYFSRFTRLANLIFGTPFMLIFGPIMMLIIKLFYKYDLVIGHYTTTAGFLTKFYLKTPKIIIAMGSDLLIDIKSFKKFFVINALKSADLVLVDNRTGIKNIEKLKLKAKIQFFVLGVNITQKIMKLEEKIKNDEIIVWNRGYNEIYNLKTLLFAIFELNERGFENLNIKIVGIGEKTNKIRGLIYELSKKNNIESIGIVNSEESLELLNKSTIYISASSSDGSSVSLLEAMYFDTTIVVSNIINNKYWVGENYKYLFDPKNHLELADILEQIFNRNISSKNRIEDSLSHFKKVNLIGQFEKNAEILDSNILEILNKRT